MQVLGLLSLVTNNYFTRLVIVVNCSSTFVQSNIKTFRVQLTLFPGLASLDSVFLLDVFCDLTLIMRLCFR